jgi:threonine synthase
MFRVENLSKMRSSRFSSQHQRTIARGQSARGVAARPGAGSRPLFPRKFPQIAPDEIAAFAKLPYHEIAFRVLSKFTDGIIPDERSGRDVPRGLQLSASRWKNLRPRLS